jgi:hypothetical protein
MAEVSIEAPVVGEESMVERLPAARLDKGSNVGCHEYVIYAF